MSETIEFRLTGHRHPIGKVRGFPQRIWYGAVDGRECTAPCYTEERAIESARYQLEHGGLKATLETSINCMQGWIKAGQHVEEAKARIKEESALLEKVQAFTPPPSQKGE